MKGLFISIILLACSSAFSQTSPDLCVAYKVDYYSYAGTMKYRVHCNDETFESKKIITAFLLPLPYNWTKRAQKYLYKEMDSRDYYEVLQLKSSDHKPGNFHDPFHVFMPNSKSLDEVCAVSYGNKQRIGLDQVKVYDFVISCSDSDEDDPLEFYSAVTTDEIEQLMQERLYNQFITFKTEGVSVYSSQKEITLKNTKTKIYYK